MATLAQATLLNSARAMPIPSECPTCKRAQFSMVFANISDDRYGYQGDFQIWKCKGCGHSLTSPALKPEEIPHLYRNHYPRKEVDVNSLKRLQAKPQEHGFAPFFRWWSGTNNLGQHHAKKNSKVLDFGSGDCTSLIELQHRGAIPFGIETDENSGKIAKELGLNLHVGVLDDKPFPNEDFDLIVLNQVIEHLLDPKGTIQELASRLSSNGEIFLSFPNAGSVYRYIFGKKWINWHIPYHQQHFTKRSFRLLCQQAGLRIKSMKTVTPNLWTLIQLRIAINPNSTTGIWGKPSQSATIPSTANSGLAKPTKRMKPISFVKKCARILAAASLAIINRLVDQVGLGDSIVVVVTKQ